MNYDLNMPLSDLVAKLLQGEADELHEEDLHAYMDNLTHGDKKGLQQALKKWKNPLWSGKIPTLLKHMLIK